jgi:hypothetical protein
MGGGRGGRVAGAFERGGGGREEKSQEMDEDMEEELELDSKKEKLEGVKKILVEIVTNEERKQKM